MEVDKENDVKKSKVYQFKQYSAGKLPLGNKSGGQKFSLRNNAFKPLKRAESSTSDNFFHLKSAMGQRNSFNDKKFTKGDGFEMLARGTDSFKKFEPIGRTLQTFQMNKRQSNNNSNHNTSNVKRGSAIYHDQSKQPIWYNNFGMATGGGFQSNNNGNKMQRANSSTHGFKSNNFMKTSEGFNSSSKRALTYVNPHYTTNNNNNSKQTAIDNLKNNNNNNNNANENSRNSQNTNIPTSTASNSTNNFNFKKQIEQESNSGTGSNGTNNNNIKKFRNSKTNGNTITKKKINDAMQKASLYTDDVIRRQFVFEQQEREEEEQFIELCGMLNSIQLN